MRNIGSLSRYITADLEIYHGRPVFRGTRIPVVTALEYLEAGKTVEDILRGYPSLNRKAIRAAIRYARLRLQDEDFIPIAKAG